MPAESIQLPEERPDEEMSPQDMMTAADEIGFDVVKYNIDIRSRETEEELSGYYADVKKEFERMADEGIDAFFLTADLVNDPDHIEEMLKPLYEKNIPVYAMDDINTVRKGALMIISASTSPDSLVDLGMFLTSSYGDLMYPIGLKIISSSIKSILKNKLL